MQEIKEQLLKIWFHMLLYIKQMMHGTFWYEQD